jgi:SAM-dependent methyltransferase
MPDVVETYGTAYEHYASDALSAVRRETYDEDIGQNSWLNAAELRQLLEWMNVGPQTNVLEVACGSGGPACYAAQLTGCRLTGIDNTAEGIVNAQKLSAQMRLTDRATFVEADANDRLPFADDEFDALLCIDALNHLRDRRFVISEWARVLRSGGAMTFTDPVVVTGAVTNAELALRSSIGFFLFVPPGYTEKLLTDAGLRIERVVDASDAAASTSARRRAARARVREALLQFEGEAKFEAFQDFLQVVHDLTASRRLSRYIFHAVKP